MEMSMKSLPLSLLGLMLAGCAAVGPDYHEPPTTPPATAAAWHGGDASLRDTAVLAEGAAAYSHFDDPVLRMLQAQALAANHDLKTATLQFAQSRLQRDIAASAQGPQLNARAAALRQRQSESGAGTRMVDAIAPANRDTLVARLSDPFDLYQVGFDSSWELDLWGRVRRATEAADADTAAASSLLRQVHLSVAVEVARNYFELRASRRQQALLRAEIAAAADMLALVEARRRGGLATDMEVARQLSAVAELRTRLPALLEQEALAGNRLTLLTAAAPGTWQQTLAGDDAADAAAPFGRTPDLSQGISSEAVTHRPDIQAAEARLHAATARIGVASADLYPRLTLGLSFGLEALRAGQLDGWGSRQWTLGPSLQLPLFDNGRRRATVELRELAQQEAAVAFQQTVLKAWHEMDDALSAYAAERQRQQQLQQREAAARATLALASMRQRQGLSDALAPLEAQRALLAVQRERLAGEAALTLRLLAICKASGVVPEA
jgi:NodT family efflux transporter outer membrane factor (OMF) lipoprotein